jgi:hypothetical protein
MLRLEEVLHLAAPCVRPQHTHTQTRGIHVGVGFRQVQGAPAVCHPPKLAPKRPSHPHAESFYAMRSISYMWPGSGGGVRGVCVCGGVPVLVEHLWGGRKTHPQKQTGSSGPSPPSPCPPGSQSNHVATTPKHLFVRESRAREGGASCCTQCGWGGGVAQKQPTTPAVFWGTQ